MKESDRNQAQQFRLPPSWCASLCKNSMNEKCVADCALKRDCSGFELKPGLNLIDMPRFPIDQIGEMTREEKLTSVAVYLAKTVDHLKGVQDEPKYPPLRRRNYDSSTSSEVSPNLQVKDLLPHLAAGAASFEIGEERPSETIGPDEVAGTSD